MNSFKHRRLIKTDGTVAYTFDNKLHSWDGPALIPQGDNKLAEYHIHGIPYNIEEWKEMRQDREGVPFYKNVSMRNLLSDYRN